MSWVDSVKDQAIAAPIFAAIGFFAKSVADYLGRRQDIDKVREEKEPDRDRVWMDGMMKLVERLEKQIEALTEEVADLNEHIDNLTGCLQRHNIAPPPRRRRGGTASSEISGD